MSGEIAVVCTRADPASLNIYESLLELQSWQCQEGYRSYGRWRLIVHDGKQTSLGGLDDRLADLGLHPEMVVFASRHEAKAGLPWLGGHFTGILKDGQSKLSAAAPSGLSSFLHNIADQSVPGFAISAEATHHGPVDLKTPCFFAEIGSTLKEWQNRQAGEAVARAILALDPKELPVFLGFGGGHYVARQTDLMFKAAVAFGHLFSNYQMAEINRNIVEDARSKSKATYTYLDRKSLRSEEKKRIVGILAELNLPELRSREIRAKFPLQQKDYTH
ncbi:MAG TPA: D-aminoacyl-tRNA deacylase [Methanothrix sp.]|nr:D-aminoacyl-tRNA deacylase [Methanothrix sp.]